MVYEVWRADSPFNLSAAYETRAAALAALHGTLTAQGPDFLARFSLISRDSRNRRRTVAEGADLIALVRGWRGAAGRTSASPMNGAAAGGKVAAVPAGPG